MQLQFGPLLICAGISTLWQMVGHYLWMPPRHTLHKLEAYTWGVFGLLLGGIAYGVLTWEWCIAVGIAALAFPSGAVTVAMWLTDDRDDQGKTIKDKDHSIKDLQDENAVLRRRLEDAKRA